MPYLHSFTDQHCPNCGRTVDFQLLYAHSLAVQDSSSPHKRWRAHDTDFRGLFTCSHCTAPVTLDFRISNLTPVEQHQLKIDSINYGQAARFLNRLQPEILYRPGSTQRYSAGITFESHEWGAKLNPYFTIIAQYPSSVVQVPTGIPKELETDFNEIREVAGSTRYTVVACRLLLEKACKLILGEDAPSNANLMKLIDLALTHEKTVSAIVKWAHAIRTFGNEAVHENGPAPTSEEAKEVFEFTSLLMELLFSYPARITSIRKTE